MYKTGLSFLVLGLALLFSFTCQIASQEEEVYWIAFVGAPQWIENPDCSGLCIVRSDGSEVRSLTEDVSFASPLAWSPDGEWIAYVFQGDVYRIRIDGQGSEKLLDNFALLRFVWRNTNQDWLDQIYEVSPDLDVVTDIIWAKKHLIMRVTEGLGFGGSPYNIYSLSISSNEIQQLTDFDTFSVSYLSISPDNQFITFARVGNCFQCNPPIRSGNLYTLKTDGSQHIEMGDNLHSVEQVAEPSWSNDGSIYFFKQQNDARLSIERIDPITQSHQIIVSEIDFTLDQVWDLTATSHFVYFIGVVDQMEKVHIVDLNTSTIHVVPENHVYEFEDIALSPASDEIAVSGATAPTIGGGGIYLMQPDGEFRTLTDGYSEIYSPTWSPVPIHE